MTQTAHTFSRRVSQRVALEYLLHLPPAYSRRTKYPLILFLHGSGERGNDIHALKKHGIPKIVEQQPDFPFITLAPQCPPNNTWIMQRDALLMLLDQVMAKHAVVRQLIDNRWLHLWRFEGAALLRYEHGAWLPLRHAAA